MIVRETQEQDLPSIRMIHQAAFGQEEEASLTIALLDDPTALPLLSLIAELDERPVAHVLFTHVKIANTRSIASILAPLAVLPEVQNRGVGGELVKQGLRQLANRDTDLAFVLGYPDYYRRFGFRAAGALGLEAPYPIAPENADAWMVVALKEGLIGQVTGRVVCAETLSKPEYWIE